MLPGVTAELTGAKEGSWLPFRPLTPHGKFLFSTSSGDTVRREPGFTDNLDLGKQALVYHSLRECLEKTFCLPGKHRSRPSGFI